MAINQKAIPYKGTDYDSNENFIEEFKAFFMKNVTNSTNSNPGSTISEGDNMNAFTPLESNTLYCAVTLPAGANYACGFKYFKSVNQGFVCVHNSNGDHLIYRLKCDTGTCEIVYKKSCLNFQLVPGNFIGESRMSLETTCRFNKVTGLDEQVLYLILVDDYNDQRMICVEDAIATNSFDPVLFPYFSVVDGNCNPCYNINLGLAQNLDCIGITPVPRPVPGDPGYAADSLLPNKTVNKGWQFRIKYTDVWKRGAEHGVISEKYIPVVGGACITGSDGLPRCFKLIFKAGCPIVDKIAVEFRNCNGNVKGLSVESDWFEYDIINKYNDCDDVNWWERTIATDPNQGWTYNALNNTIEYIFCANKDCKPLPVNETNRNENYLPLTSGGVAPLNKGISLSKNTRNFEPLHCDELDKVEFTVEPPVSTAGCQNNKLRKVVIYGVLYSFYNDAIVNLRYRDNKIVWGVADCPNNNPFAYHQTLPIAADGTKQEGIIGYMAGTKHYVISKQYVYNHNTGLEHAVPIGGGVPGRTVQRWEFDLPPGKYVFRVASHLSLPTDDYQKTSTNVFGQTSWGAMGFVGTQAKEIMIDACAGDVEIKAEPLLIYDLTRTGNKGGCGNASNVTTGYIYEDEIEKRPIELAIVAPNQGSIASFYTDHNGYYFAASKDRGIQTTIRGRKNCAYVNLAVGSISYDTAGSWHKHDVLYAYHGASAYLSKDRATVKGKVVLCSDNTIGVAGVAVVLTNGAAGITGTDGFFRIPAHDKGNSATRNDNIVYSQNGTCIIMACGVDCDFCMLNANVTIPACTGTDRVITVANRQVNINGYNKKGPHMGGRYGIGVVLHDWLGRETYVQIREHHYVNIPSLQQTLVYDYSKIFFDITGLVLPLWVKRLSFFITDNLNEDDWMTWVAERVTYVDNTGKLNNAAPTKIRLYYESLAEYNKQGDLSTNTVWDFIAADEKTRITGDYIEFLANGDGVIFPKIIREPVTYDKIGTFLTVPYSEDLKLLKDGALIKLIRPKNCEVKQFYYELCPMIYVVNGVPQTLTGELKFFDSFLLTRQIPVPVTISVVNGTVTTSVTENQLRNYPFLFEHPSPSDFWGDHCHTRGRVSVENDLQNKQCRNTEICVGKALTLDNLVNGLNYFDSDDAVVFDEQEWGSITAHFSDVGQVLVICRNKNFMVPFNDTNIKVDAQGKVYAPSAADRFGRPQKISGGDYGIDQFDINTLSRLDDVIMGLDTLNAELVIFTFGGAKAAFPTGAKAWLSANIKAMMVYNNAIGANKMYFHGVIDSKPAGLEYILTIARINQVSADYTNQYDEIKTGVNDTIVVNISNKTFRGQRSYTPELFGAMPGDIGGGELIAFKFASAWKHHFMNIANPSFNNFFGVQCESIFEFVFNIDNTKSKFYMWLELYCKEVLLYADRIKTASGQLSRIMPLWWEKRDKFWAADFKCATNTVADTQLPVQTGVNALLDGDVLYGTWVRVRIRPQAKDRGKYFEFVSLICFMNGSEKSGAG